MAGKVNPRFEAALTLPLGHTERPARRDGAHEALMLVHSFDPDHSSLDAYRAFAAVLGLTNAAPNAITTSTLRDDVTLRLGWVKEC